MGIYQSQLRYNTRFLYSIENLLKRTRGLRSTDIS